MTNDAARALAKGLGGSGKGAQTVRNQLAAEIREKFSHYESDDDDSAERNQHRSEALRELAQFNRDLASGKFHADLEARRQADAEAARVEALPAAGRLAEAIRGGSTGHIPLNGPGVIQAMMSAIGSGATTRDPLH